MPRPTKEQREERERLAELGLKQCSEKEGCGLVKSVDEFGAKKGKWDNKNTICRACNRKNVKKYYNENKEAKLAYHRQYWIDNIDEKREYGRKHRAKKKQDDPMYARLREGKARAKKAGAEWDNFKSTELLSYWEQKGITMDSCYYCNNHIELDDLQLDHGIPLSRGGSHSLDNLFPSHKKCNRDKFDKNVEEYLEHLKQVS